MALKISGVTVLNDSSNASFQTATISSGGLIEIPDHNTPNSSFGTASYKSKSNNPIQIVDASWSWWQKPLVLRDVKSGNNWTYTGFTSANGAIGIAVTNNYTLNTVQYIVANAGLFSVPDDHNAGIVYAGNGKVALMFQGRCIENANTINGANNKNFFYAVWNEGAVSGPVATASFGNLLFNYQSPNDPCFYPNMLVANNKILVMGRQTANSNGSAPNYNNWNYVLGDWPISTSTSWSSPAGFIKFDKYWPYMAISRSTVDKDKFVYGVGWHPYDSDNTRRNLFYGSLRRSTNSSNVWDVFKSTSTGESYYGNLGTGHNMPASINIEVGTADTSTAFELAYYNYQHYTGMGSTFGEGSLPSGGASWRQGTFGYLRTRILDVTDNAVAFVVYSNNFYRTVTSMVNSGNSHSTMNIGGTYWGAGSPTLWPKANVAGYLSWDEFGDTADPLSYTFVYYPPDYYNSHTIKVTGGTNYTMTPNTATIISYNVTTGIITFDRPLAFPIDSSHTVQISANNVGEYRVAYKLYDPDPEFGFIGWRSHRVCNGGRDFSGGAPAGAATLDPITGQRLDLRNYPGGMAFSRQDRYTIYVSREHANNWHVEEYKLDAGGNYGTYTIAANSNNLPWIVTPLYTGNAATALGSYLGPIIQRPYEEMYSEDAMLNYTKLWDRFIGDGSNTYFYLQANTATYKGYLSPRSNRVETANIYQDPISEAWSSNAIFISTKAFVYIDGVLKSPGTDYTEVRSSTGMLTALNFSTAPLANSVIELHCLGDTRGFIASGDFNKRDYANFKTNLFSYKNSTNANNISINSGLNFRVSSMNVADSIIINSPTVEYGFASGGQNAPSVTIPAPGIQFNTIEKYTFASDSNATDHGDLSMTGYGSAAQSSDVNGYASGAQQSSIPTIPVTLWQIDRFPFVNQGGSTIVGNLSQYRRFLAGQSSSTHGYSSGGVSAPTTTPSDFSNVIDKFPFSVESNATDVGDLTIARQTSAGSQSSTHGYNAGGGIDPGLGTQSAAIDKFPFSSDSNATSVGSLVGTARRNLVGNFSSTHGYAVGGNFSPVTASLSSVIEKYPYSSDTNSSTVGNLTSAKRWGAGSSSSTHGYFAGGDAGNGTVPGITTTSAIEKYPFSTDTNSSSIANLVESKYGQSGHQG